LRELPVFWSPPPPCFAWSPSPVNGGGYGSHKVAACSSPAKRGRGTAEGGGGGVPLQNLAPRNRHRQAALRLGGQLLHRPWLRFRRRLEAEARQEHGKRDDRLLKRERR